MERKGQGAIEYLLIIGAAILVVAIVILAVTGALGSGKTASAQGTVEADKSLCTVSCTALGSCGTALAKSSTSCAGKFSTLCEVGVAGTIVTNQCAPPATLCKTTCVALGPDCLSGNTGTTPQACGGISGCPITNTCT